MNAPEKTYNAPASAGDNSPNSTGCNSPIFQAGVIQSGANVTFNVGTLPSHKPEPSISAPIDVRHNPEVPSTPKNSVSVRVIVNVAAILLVLFTVFRGVDANQREDTVPPGVPTPIQLPIRKESKAQVAEAYPALANSTFKKLSQASQEHPFENSLGMQMVPFEVSGSRPLMLFARFETTVDLFKEFANDTSFGEVLTEKRDKDGQRASGSWKSHGFPPDFRQTDQHPVLWINVAEARQFCAWITQKEQKERIIPLDWSYDLPQANHWQSVFKQVHQSPSDFMDRLEGNWADARLDEAAAGRGPSFVWKLPGYASFIDYNDGQIFTSPVGAAQKSLARHLYDLPGNVAEMTLGSEIIDGLTSYRVMGGAWDFGVTSSDKVALRATIANWFITGWPRVADERYCDVGFRCILGPQSDQEPQSSSSAQEKQGGY
jgi:formylglycine-generating enzyme required for sulfatase activity